jgi:hypothetical protein
LGQRFLDLAQLSFDYEGARVIGKPSTAVNWRSGEEVLHIFRQLRAEDTARTTLKAFGLQNFPGADALLGKSYDARLGEPWMLSDPDAWLHFMAEVVPKLRAAGWYIETSEDFRYKLVEADEEWQATVEATGNDWFKLGLSLTVDGREVRLLPLLTQLLADRASSIYRRRHQSLPKDARVMFRLDSERVLSVPFDRVRHILGTLVWNSIHDPGSQTLTLSWLDAARLAELENSAPALAGRRRAVEIGAPAQRLRWYARCGAAGRIRRGAAPVSATGTRLAAVLARVRVGRHPRRRYGLGQDYPDACPSAG